MYFTGHSLLGARGEAGFRGKLKFPHAQVHLYFLIYLCVESESRSSYVANHLQGSPSSSCVCTYTTTYLYGYEMENEDVDINSILGSVVGLK